MNKAQGLDGIPTVAIKAAIVARHGMFRISGEVKNTKIDSTAQTSETTWRRPIDVQTNLDIAGKLLERIVLSRFRVFPERTDSSGFSDNQFGFRRVDRQWALFGHDSSDQNSLHSRA